MTRDPIDLPLIICFIGFLFLVLCIPPAVVFGTGWLFEPHLGPAIWTWCWGIAGMWDGLLSATLIFLFVRGGKQ